MQNVKKQDQEIFDIYLQEELRQKQWIEIIASENYVSQAVLEATWSILTNKYSEWYPGKRYYGGNQFIDQIENLAISRAKELFDVDFVNVQAHSGSSANLAIYFSLLEAGDTVMWMALSSGWHLTHWHKVNFSGKIYNAVQYWTDEDGYIDYDQVRALALQHKPKMIICGFTAYPRIFSYAKFREIANEVGAYLVADISHIAGLIAGKQFENPCKICDVIMTTTHKTLRWPRWAIIMTNSEKLAKKINKTIIPWCQWWPLEHVIMAKAVAFQEALKPEFQDYAAQIIKNTKVFEKVFATNGIEMTTWWTDNHLIVADMKSLWIDGTIAEETLEYCDISCNKNTIPWDTSPFKPSGIRLGTAALTTRWLKEEDIEVIANIVIDTLKNHNQKENLTAIKEKVHTFMSWFPIFAR